MTSQKQTKELFDTWPDVPAATPPSSAKSSTGSSKPVPQSTLASSQNASESQEKPGSNWKETNPKDLVGSTKLPMELVPDTMIVEATPAFLEGALKYGRYNWRICGVRASIYRAALQRHLVKWWNGEDRDPVTGVKHLASALACIAIVLDADACDKLTDDRPPRAPIARKIEIEPHIEYLKQLFKQYQPKQYTIEDGVESNESDLFSGQSKKSPGPEGGGGAA